MRDSRSTRKEYARSLHGNCTRFGVSAASVVLRQVAVDGMNPAPEVVENMASVVEQAGHKHGDDDPAEFLFRVDCLGAAPERLDF